MNYYKLQNKKVIPCTQDDWLNMTGDEKRVDFNSFGEVEVSTVFLGIDHRYGKGQPIVFETMIFGGKHDGYQTRYSTWEEAVEGHKIACNLANEVAIERNKKLNNLGL